MDRFSGHYISGTHWDREWYRPFQEYRFLLVKLIDDLLNLMETNAEFRYFQLDGQTCILEDYLEVRPENRTRLRTLIQSGRILIGPWFTMPELFCVGDEALIRNLLLGRKISREWGVEPMPVGFICDMFGHPSQMPQIFQGFGYGDCVLGRGTNESTTPPFFHWESPDGSRVFTFKLQDSQGYGAFAIPRATLEKEDLCLLNMLPEFHAELEAAGTNRQQEVRERHFRLELSKYVNHEISRSNGERVLCLMDSMDHMAPAAEVSTYLRLIGEACPEVDPVHSTLPAFFAEARGKADSKMLVRRGELREPSRNASAYLWLIPNCPSARVRLKMANDECQTLLERWADPFVALANLRGALIPKQHLTIAWKHLLSNHAHDSIGGCSIDQVHRDMIYRFDQARTLGQQLTAQAIGYLTRTCADLAREKDQFTLTIVNPVPQARDEVVIFHIDLPLDYPASFRESFFSQSVKSFVLEDAQGALVPYQRLSFQPQTDERSRYAKFCFQSDGAFTRYTVAAKVALSGLGFTSLLVKPSKQPVRAPGSLRTGPASAANEFLVIELASNGTLILTDRVTGQTYRDLLTFEDRSEIGDGWFHVHCLNDEQLLSTGASAQIAVVHDGPEIVTLRSTVTLLAPASHSENTKRSSPELVPIEITSLISLRRGARVIEVEITVNNAAEDHRLRLLLPTDVHQAETYLAHHPFDFVERPIAIDTATASWQEVEQSEKPFLGIQSVGAQGRGLAFLSAAGPHEGGVCDDARRTMHITLLRSFRRTITTGGETGGLEKGITTFRFALLPFDGDLPRAAVLAELAVLQSGIHTRQTGKRPSGYPPMTGAESPTQTFLECRSGRLAISALKLPETGDGLILRLWNPTGTAQREEIRFGLPVTSVEAVELNEEPAAQPCSLKAQGDTVEVTAPPHRIVTLRVVLAPTSKMALN